MRTHHILVRWMLGAALALGLLLCAACGQTLVPSAGQGTLHGQVVAGPMCGVQPANRTCPDQPVANRTVSIETSAGTVVATATTDTQGKFNIVLDAGSYVVRVAIIRGQVGMRQSSPGNVVVRAGATVSVTIVLDTGIR